MGRVPGGGLGCLLGLVIVGFVLYYTVKGLYYVLWWATPALLVLALIVNWRVFPDTIKNWLGSLETRPVSALFSAALAVVAFPFFALWLFLKALGYKKMQEVKSAFEREQQRQNPRDEFVDFEEIESKPMEKPATPEILEVPVKPKKEDNPYDGFFQ